MGLTTRRGQQCSVCGTLVPSSHFDRHKNSKACQTKSIKMQRTRAGYFAVSRQLRSVLDKWSIKYDTEEIYAEPVNKTKYAPAHKEEVPVLFVKGLFGALSKYLSHRPLKWALKNYHDNEEFKAAVDSVMLLSPDDLLSVARHVGRMWEDRKGKHKNKRVQAKRAKAPNPQVS